MAWSMEINHELFNKKIETSLQYFNIPSLLNKDKKKEHIEQGILSASFQKV